MKRTLIGTLSIVALSLLLTSGAYAQSAEHVLVADVPFAFTAWKMQMPAGRYKVMTTGSSAILIRSCDTGRAALSLARRDQAKSADPKLVFHVFGDKYFLSEVRGISGNLEMILPTSKLEKEMQLASAPTRANDEYVIAHK